MNRIFSLILMLVGIALSKPNDSFISYVIHHPFKDVKFISHEQTVSIESNDSILSEMNVYVDINTLKSGISWVDDWELRIVEWNKYRDIEFNSSKITNSQNNKFLIQGKINFHGVTKEIVIPAEYVDGALVGTFELRIEDFNLQKPRPFKIPVDDFITVSFKFKNGDDNGR